MPHEWSLFVRGPGGVEDAEEVRDVAKVEFRIHESYDMPVIVEYSFPFEMDCAGIEAFEAQILITTREGRVHTCPWMLDFSKPLSYCNVVPPSGGTVFVPGPGGGLLATVSSEEATAGTTEGNALTTQGNVEEWRTEGHEWIGRTVARKFVGAAAANTFITHAQVIRWLPEGPDPVEDEALWHIRHEDGDEEDLGEAEMRDALALQEAKLEGAVASATESATLCALRPLIA